VLRLALEQIARSLSRENSGECPECFVRFRIRGRTGGGGSPVSVWRLRPGARSASSSTHDNSGRSRADVREPHVLPDGDSSSACLEPERQAVRAVMALRASTRPRAAPGDGPCANVRCRNRGHSPVRGRSTTGQHGSRRVRGRRVLRGPLGDRSGQGRSALVIITGASTSCGGWRCGDISWRECSPAEGHHPSSHSRPHGGALRCGWRRAEPQWRAFGRWCNCLEWLQAASGGAQSAATLTSRSRVEGASCCGPQGEQLEASTRASGRRGGGDQGPEAMIASRT
jgi:hypothetical protein